MIDTILILLISIEPIAKCDAINKLCWDQWHLSARERPLGTPTGKGTPTRERPPATWTLDGHAPFYVLWFLFSTRSDNANRLGDKVRKTRSVHFIYPDSVLFVVLFVYRSAGWFLFPERVAKHQEVRFCWTLTGDANASKSMQRKTHFHKTTDKHDFNQIPEERSDRNL